MKTLLEKYCEELGVGLTLDQLIDSHRNLRNMNLENRIEINRELDKARQFGREQGFDQVTNGLYIDVVKLKNMTIAELVEFIGSE